MTSMSTAALTSLENFVSLTVILSTVSSITSAIRILDSDLCHAFVNWFNAVALRSVGLLDFRIVFTTETDP